MSNPSEFTTGEIAKQLGAQRYSIEYIIDSRSIEPARRIGITRLFDRAAFAQIESALHEIQARREIA